MAGKPDLSAALDLKFDSDLGKKSFRHYFTTLLTTLIEQDERFSGKRPFGNSDWFNDLALGLHEHGLLAGDPDDLDLQKAAKIVLGMIPEMCRGA